MAIDEKRKKEIFEKHKKRFEEWKKEKGYPDKADLIYFNNWINVFQGEIIIEQEMKIEKLENRILKLEEFQKDILKIMEGWTERAQL